MFLRTVDPLDCWCFLFPINILRSNSQASPRVVYYVIVYKAKTCKRTSLLCVRSPYSVFLMYGRPLKSGCVLFFISYFFTTFLSSRPLSRRNTTSNEDVWKCISTRFIVTVHPSDRPFYSLRFACDWFCSVSCVKEFLKYHGIIIIYYEYGFAFSHYITNDIGVRPRA